MTEPNQSSAVTLSVMFPTSSPLTMCRVVYRSSPMAASPSSPRSFMVTMPPPNGVKSTVTDSMLNSASVMWATSVPVLPPSPIASPSRKSMLTSTGAELFSAVMMEGERMRSTTCDSLNKAVSFSSPKGSSKLRTTLETRPMSGPSSTMDPFATPPESPYVPVQWTTDRLNPSRGSFPVAYASTVNSRPSSPLRWTTSCAIIGIGMSPVSRTIVMSPRISCASGWVALS